MKTSVINLKFREDRNIHMLDQLVNTNLDYFFVEAVNGENLSDNELKENTLIFSESFLAKGEMGCALSHLNIYQ